MELRTATLTLALALSACTVDPGLDQLAQAAPLLPLSADPFDSTTGGPDVAHAAQVEVSAAAHGATIVAVAQSGRYYYGGSMGVSWITFAAGRWRTGLLPGVTSWPPQDRAADPAWHAGVYDRATNPVVAYDAAHGVWLASAYTFINGSTTASAALPVSRSADGVSWEDPVVAYDSATAPAPAGGTNAGIDKDWIGCDNFATRPSGATNPNYGTCYLVWLDTNHTDAVPPGGPNNAVFVFVKSTDGGRHWGGRAGEVYSNLVPATDSNATTFGLGRSPVVNILPSGRLVVTAISGFHESGAGTTTTSFAGEDTPNGGPVDPEGPAAVASGLLAEGTMVSIVSDDAAETVTTGKVTDMYVERDRFGLRYSSYVQAGVVDGRGTLWLAWSDRLAAGNQRGDVVFWRSTDGVTWTSRDRAGRSPSRLNPDDARLDQPGKDYVAVSLAAIADPSRPATVGLTAYSADTTCGAAPCPPLTLHVEAATHGDGCKREWNGISYAGAPAADGSPEGWSADWFPSTSRGRFFGDYVATVFAGDGSDLHQVGLVVVPAAAPGPAYATEVNAFTVSPLVGCNDVDLPVVMR